MAMKIVVGMNAGVVCSSHTGGTTSLDSSKTPEHVPMGTLPKSINRKELHRSQKRSIRPRLG